MTDSWIDLQLAASAAKPKRKIKPNWDVRKIPRKRIALIEAAREGAHLTVCELARAAGVPAVAYNDVVLGHRKTLPKCAVGKIKLCLGV